MNWELQKLLNLNLLSTDVNVTGNVCSKANASPKEKACVQKLSVLQSEWNRLLVLSKEAKFPGLQYPCGYAFDSNKQILVVTLQCHHILMQELENGIASGKPKVYGLVSILHAAASLKAVLPFDFVNTSGQKPSTLHAHFKHPY